MFGQTGADDSGTKGHCLEGAELIELGQTGAGNNRAKGYCTLGTKMIDSVLSGPQGGTGLRMLAGLRFVQLLTPTPNKKGAQKGLPKRDPKPPIKPDPLLGSRSKGLDLVIQVQTPWTGSGFLDRLQTPWTGSRPPGPAPDPWTDL